MQQPGAARVGLDPVERRGDALDHPAAVVAVARHGVDAAELALVLVLAEDGPDRVQRRADPSGQPPGRAVASGVATTAASSVRSSSVGARSARTGAATLR